MTLLDPAAADFAFHTPIAIIGAGACGLVAALSAKEAGAEIVVFERDSAPAGSTALSSGMIPAAGTRLQAAAGVEDSAALFAADIQGKSKGRSDPAVLAAATQAAGPAIDWLNAFPEVTLDLVQGFLYPGHSVARMHAPPDRTGRSLMGMLVNAAAARGVDIVTDATVSALFAEGSSVKGMRITRPDETIEDISCDALILACNGYGGNKSMVAEHIPEMKDALYFGHAGNQGEAVAWGAALGGEAKHLSGYQGHGNVAHPHGVLITWALMMEGGIQVNARGARFSNEHAGYSEQAVEVLAQPGGVAWAVFDERLLRLGREFDDFAQAEAQGALRKAETVPALALAIGVDDAALTASVAETAGESIDAFGRDWSKTPALTGPCYAIKVTGALFHTQGGLRIDEQARVLRAGSEAPLGNLYAGGGAACGLSGPDVDGYLSGNGLLTAVALGRVAGRHAAASLGD
ncbi:MAG: FAD-dependent oxidoreductase [Alphaproteobacteria bacterium]|nr:FAD-dependent oxidoreductase [Alphaproteobacteria bacterium]